MSPNGRCEPYFESTLVCHRSHICGSGGFIRPGRCSKQHQSIRRPFQQSRRPSDSGTLGDLLTHTERCLVNHRPKHFGDVLLDDRPRRIQPQSPSAASLRSVATKLSPQNGTIVWSSKLICWQENEGRRIAAGDLGLTPPSRSHPRRDRQILRSTPLLMGDLNCAIRNKRKVGKLSRV